MRPYMSRRRRAFDLDERIFGVPPDRRDRRKTASSGAAVRTVVVVGVLGASWLLACLTFGVATGWGGVYEESLLGLGSANGAVETGAVGEGDVEVERREFGEGTWYQTGRLGSALEFRVYSAVGGLPALVANMWVGRLQDLERDWPASECGVGSPDPGSGDPIGYGVGWRFQGTVRNGVGLRNEGAVANCRVLFGYEGSPDWAPYARRAVDNLAGGGLQEMIETVLQEAVEGGSRAGETVALGDGVAEEMTRSLANDVMRALDQQYGEAATLFGPAQFLALGAVFVSVMLLVARRRGVVLR